jgi:hypothetical protein
MAIQIYDIKSHPLLFEGYKSPFLFNNSKEELVFSYYEIQEHLTLSQSVFICKQFFGATIQCRFIKNFIELGHKKCSKERNHKKSHKKKLTIRDQNLS